MPDETLFCKSDRRAEKITADYEDLNEFGNIIMLYPLIKLTEQYCPVLFYRFCRRVSKA